ncbi:hypothetical protein GPECTOR_34g807 [Gonium pectorale]|uniref:Inositol-phosphate phosphatase n=1 Tax=Gonium pectorale TaxID=33097 RepID=A0A150GCU9_GONPE|nr:hypothetical protein GPECTOR_34g807 [Gonium pectorale]|eukprot:KXZ47648.1 hypothetical protein GPECTOR_34g807 [Gonium pectorale]
MRSALRSSSKSSVASRCAPARKPAPFSSAGCRGARHSVVMFAAKVATDELLAVAKKAAHLGAEVVMSALDKPRTISRKEGTDIGAGVTETDKASEEAVVSAIRAAFPSHAVLGEEGGVLGDVKSEYLWCVDPLDGTVNFAHGYPSFCVSVGVLRHATPVAGCVVEFLPSGGSPAAGGAAWTMRTFSASRNGGAFADGKQIFVSGVKELRDALVATELVYYEDMWPQLSGLHRTFTEKCRGVRMSGAAAANLCHLAMGSIDAYWQYNLKPWDVAAGLLILEEAGGRVSTGDGLAYNVFDRSLLATNDALYEKVLAVTEPATSSMLEEGVSLSPCYVTQIVDDVRFTEVEVPPSPLLPYHQYGSSSDQQLQQQQQHAVQQPHQYDDPYHAYEHDSVSGHGYDGQGLGPHHHGGHRSYRHRGSEQGPASAGTGGVGGPVGGAHGQGSVLGPGGRMLLSRPDDAAHLVAQLHRIADRLARVEAAGGGGAVQRQAAPRFVRAGASADPEASSSAGGDPGQADHRRRRAASASTPSSSSAPPQPRPYFFRVQQRLAAAGAATGDALAGAAAVGPPPPPPASAGAAAAAGTTVADRSARELAARRRIYELGLRAAGVAVGRTARFGPSVAGAGAAGPAAAAAAGSLSAAAPPLSSWPAGRREQLDVWLGRELRALLGATDVSLLRALVGGLLDVHGLERDWAAEEQRAAGPPAPATEPAAAAAAGGGGVLGP